MTSKERQLLKQRISEIQRAKEEHARRLFVITPFRTKLYMGGGSRPYYEQNRGGYPSSDATDPFRRKG